MLSLLIDKATSGGFLLGFSLEGRRGEAMKITHQLFADDTLVFCNDSEEQLLYLNWILLCFEAMSRLKVNLEKSVTLPVGVVENVFFF